MENCKGGVQASGDGGGRHHLVKEVDTVKLRQVRRKILGFLPSKACVKHPREDFGAEPGGV